MVLLLLLSALARAADPVAVAAWRESVVRLEMAGSTCSGVLIDEQGTVATAYHCVAGHRRPRVETRAGFRTRGQVVATAARDDLALISAPELVGRIPARPLRQGPVRVGETIVAVGHPFGGGAGEEDTAWEGMLAWAVSEGIVSAVGPRMIQTDAALNPGTSGGPALDGDGAVIGIVSRKLSGEGVSFLSHVDQLRALVQAPREPWLGGGVYLGLTLPTPFVAGAARAVGLMIELQLRDRVILGAGAMVPLDARVQALAVGDSTFVNTQVHLSLRQRIGVGSWSSTLDLGPALFQLTQVTAEWGDESVWTVQRPGPYSPAGRLRLGTRGIGVTTAVLATEDGPTWLMALDLDWPGTMTTF